RRRPAAGPWHKRHIVETWSLHHLGRLRPWTRCAEPRPARRCASDFGTARTGARVRNLEDLMNRPRTLLLASSAAFVMASLACSGAVTTGAEAGGTEVQLQGAGATFPAPLYNRWFEDYVKAHPNAQVGYQPVGSGAGVTQFTNKTVDFGASDA